jgi:hypothetical protein
MGNSWQVGFRLVRHLPSQEAESCCVAVQYACGAARVLGPHDFWCTQDLALALTLGPVHAFRHGHASRSLYLVAGSHIMLICPA